MKASRQFLTAKDEILAAFDTAKIKAKAHEVQTYHGCFVEEKIRNWLETFLPKRYAVCAGYIVTQGANALSKFPHFDVIIYDALNSPVLWVEDLSNNASQSRAIPVEHVLAVFEVKSTINTTTIENAIDHINDLLPLSKEVDDPSERYKKFLPPNFFWGLIFVDAFASSDNSASTIFDKLITQRKVRGYYSTLILRGEGVSGCCSIKLLNGDSCFESNAKLLASYFYSLKEPNCNGRYLGVSCLWDDLEFVTFSFDILALLNGTFRIGFVSSFHGFDFPKVSNRKPSEV